MNSHVQMKGRPCQPLLHGLCAHSLLRGHPLIMIEQFHIQQLVKDLCGLRHLLLVVGQAGDQLKVSVDGPANPGGTADS